MLTTAHVLTPAAQPQLPIHLRATFSAFANSFHKVKGALWKLNHTPLCHPVTFHSGWLQVANTVAVCFRGPAGAGEVDSKAEERRQLLCVDPALTAGLLSG